MAVTAATDTATVTMNMDMDITTATSIGKGMSMGTGMDIGSTVAIVGEETVIAILIVDTRRNCFGSESATCFEPRLEDDTRWLCCSFDG